MTLPVFFAYILLCLIWGTTWLAIIFGLKDFPVFFSAFLRFGSAALIILLIVYLKKISIPFDKRSVALYLYMGVMSFFIPFGLVYWSEQHIASGLASILFAIYPFSVAIVSRTIIPEEKIHILQIIGMLIGFTGLIIIFSDAFRSNNSLNAAAMFAILVSAIMQSTVTVCVKKFGQGHHPLGLNLIPMFIGAFCFLGTAFLVEDTSKITITSTGFSAILYLSIFGSVIAFTLHYWLLKKINILFLAIIAFITPVVALFAGRIVNSEILLAHQTVGSAIVLLGILISSLRFIKKKNAYIK